jgi:hypothetical protein
VINENSKFGAPPAQDSSSLVRRRADASFPRKRHSPDLRQSAAAASAREASTRAAATHRVRADAAEETFGEECVLFFNNIIWPPLQLSFASGMVRLRIIPIRIDVNLSFVCYPHLSQWSGFTAYRIFHAATSAYVIIFSGESFEQTCESIAASAFLNSTGPFTLRAVPQFG